MPYNQGFLFPQGKKVLLCDEKKIRKTLKMTYFISLHLYQIMCIDGDRRGRIRETLSCACHTLSKIDSTLMLPISDNGLLKAILEAKEEGFPYMNNITCVTFAHFMIYMCMS